MLKPAARCLTPLLGLISLLMFSACQGEVYPTYRGHYSLVEVNDAGWAKSFPAELQIEHRMHYLGGSFAHSFRMHAEKTDDAHASGEFAFDLRDWGYAGDMRLGKRYLPGIQIGDREFGQSYGPFCNVWYYYQTRLADKDLVPAREVLDRAYETHTRSGSQDLTLSPAEASVPPLSPEAQDSWISAVGSNSGMSFVIEISRRAIADTSGCGGQALNVDPDKVVRAKYRSTDHEQTLSEGYPGAPDSAWDEAQARAETDLKSFFTQFLPAK